MSYLLISTYFQKDLNTNIDQMIRPISNKISFKMFLPICKIVRNKKFYDLTIGKKPFLRFSLYLYQNSKVFVRKAFLFA